MKISPNRTHKLVERSEYGPLFALLLHFLKQMHDDGIRINFFTKGSMDKAVKYTNGSIREAFEKSMAHMDQFKENQSDYMLLDGMRHYFYNRDHSSIPTMSAKEMPQPVKRDVDAFLARTAKMTETRRQQETDKKRKAEESFGLIL